MQNKFIFCFYFIIYCFVWHINAIVNKILIFIVQHIVLESKCITVDFQVFHFENSFKIFCLIYKIIFQYIIAIILKKNELWYIVIYIYYKYIIALIYLEQIIILFNYKTLIIKEYLLYITVTFLLFLFCIL